jgi:hypothetical protein
VVQAVKDLLLGMLMLEAQNSKFSVNLNENNNTRK